MYCENCEKEHDGSYGSGRFCDKKCACVFSTKSKRKEINAKISETLSGRPKTSRNRKYSRIAYFNCKWCGKFHVVRWKLRFRKFCNRHCANSYSNKHSGSARKAGLASAKVRVKRSANEKYFAELCSEQFNVLTNESIFNGWDADIILEDHKIAVLWNGKWHYEKITKNHSVKQVQNRDRIKIREIKKAGYIPYIIKDMGGFNKEFVEGKFEKFMSDMKNKIKI